MDGPWVSNSLEPFIVAALPTITLTTTYQALAPTWALPNLANYFSYVGKTCRIKGVGNTTSGATPGSFGFGVILGSNANNTGTVIGSVQSTWNASQTNYTFLFDFWVQCKAIGPNGQITGAGIVFLQSSGIFPINYNTVPTLVSLDTTATNYLSPQAYRTGSTAETWGLHDLWFESVN